MIPSTSSSSSATLVTLKICVHQRRKREREREKKKKPRNRNMGCSEIGVGGFRLTWDHGWVGGFQVGVGHGTDTARTPFATSWISRCRPTEEEESLADDGEEEELRRTWQRALTSFALIRISIWSSRVLDPIPDLASRFFYASFASTLLLLCWNLGLRS